MNRCVFLIVLLIGLTSCTANRRGGSSLEHPELGTLSDQDLALMEQKRWQDGNIPQAQADGFFQDIHFEYDSSMISTEDRTQLSRDSELLKEDASLQVEVEGHCDRRGTNEYNFALGEQRARSVADLLVSFGVSKNQISIISYGEELPIDPADSEPAYAQNRRVHFALFRKGEGETGDSSGSRNSSR